MASTFSNLKIELIATGEQSGTWGSTTNTNLGTAIEQAITGSVDITFASADVTLTLTDTNAAQNARALRLNLTGTSGGARNLIVPAIAKQYIVNNGLADAVTVKNSTGTGIAVPAGKTMVVFNNATNVVDVTTYASSLTLGAALPITSGGTGTTSTTFVNLASNVTGTLPVANGGTGTTSTTFVNLATNVTGTLPVANGGTGQTSASAAFNALSPITTAGDLIVGNGSNSATRLGIGANGTILTSNGTTATWVAAAPTGVTSFSAGTTGFTPSTGTTGAVTLAGTLAVTNGGTGATTLTTNNVILGNGTSAVQFVAPGTAGNVLTSNGTTWVSQAPSSGGAVGSTLYLNNVYGGF